MKSTIGVIGLGIMGSSIARHVAHAGYRVAGYDVRPARLREITAAGGVAASSSSDVARQSRILITSLPSSDALAQTVDALVKTSHRSFDRRRDEHTADRCEAACPCGAEEEGHRTPRLSDQRHRCAGAQQGHRRVRQRFACRIQTRVERAGRFHPGALLRGTVR